MDWVEAQINDETIFPVEVGEITEISVFLFEFPMDILYML